MSTNWKFTNCKEKPLLLFSSLDWGLGHTTRSIPLLKEFLNYGCNLIVACNSIQKEILQPELQGAVFVDLEGYGLIYGHTGWGTRLKLIFQLRKILTRIKKENDWLNSFINKNEVDALISDNRYGFYHPGIPSVFITHQLFVETGYGSFFNKISQKFLYKYINRFSECWVPDFKKNNSLAGKLSQPKINLAVPVKYLGALSRFEKCDQTTEKKFDLLIMLSGPEPQRTILEKLMLKQSQRVEIKIALVRGLPAESEELHNGQVKIFNHLKADQLNNLICASEMVICRSGYTTIMDLVKLKKKMIVIPTPGQPEQEYLAEHLSQNNLAVIVKQKKFSLPHAMEVAGNFTFTHIDTNMNEYKIVIKEFVEKISSLSPSSMC